MTSDATYQRVPTSSPTRGVSSNLPTLLEDRPLRSSVQAEFDRPAPAWWKRFLIVVALLFMAWATVKLGGMGHGKDEKPQVIYASR